MHETYLVHGRRKGSKNGIRLFQYKSGRYTDLGREEHRIAEALRTGRDPFGGGSKRSYSDNYDPYSFVNDVFRSDKSNGQNNKGDKSNDQDKKTQNLNKDSNATSNVGKAMSDILKGSKDAYSSYEKIKNSKKNLEKARAFDKEVAKLSDDEIKKIKARLELETNYRDALAKRYTVAGRVSTMEVLNILGGIATVGIGFATLRKLAKGD